MKVLYMKVQHIMGLKGLVELDVRDHHLILVGGKNHQGKTSFLKALLMAICGKRGIDWPDKVIHEGETSAEVEIGLSGDASLGEYTQLTVRMTIDKKRTQEVEKIEILDSSGESAPNPRTLLKDLYSAVAFDPLAFEKLPAKDQRETIAKLVGVDLDSFRNEFKEVYDERTEVNREHKRLKATMQSMKRHADAPAELIKVDELMVQLKDVQLKNKGIDEAERKIKAFAEKETHCRDRIAELEEELRLARVQYEAAEKALHFAQKKKEELGDRVDEAGLYETLSEADLLNQKYRDNVAYAEAKQACRKQDALSNELTEKLERISEKVDKSLQEAKFPVESMSLDNEGVLLNGRAFCDNSRSERIYASAMIGMAMNPTLRLLVCEDGSDLDNDCIESLDSFMKEHDFQCLVELVTRSTEDEERCTIVFENGEAK